MKSCIIKNSACRNYTKYTCISNINMYSHQPRSWPIKETKKKGMKRILIKRCKRRTTNNFSVYNFTQNVLSSFLSVFCKDIKMSWRYARRVFEKCSRTKYKVNLHYKWYFEKTDNIFVTASTIILLQQNLNKCD